MTSLSGKSVAVMGLARSGIAAANFLLREGAAVTVVDAKKESELGSALGLLDGKVRARLGPHAEDVLLDAELVVLSPGIPLAIPPLQKALERGIPVISEVELAWRHLPGRFIGVTGSNGKTTVSTLLAAVLAGAGFDAVASGNIGTPLTRFLLAPELPKERIYVVELSSFQLETVDRFHCEIALFLNLTPDHLDRYPDFETYGAAKLRLFRNQTSEDYAVVSPELAQRVAAVTPARLLTFSPDSLSGEGAAVTAGEIRLRLAGKDHPVMPVNEIPLRGRHNLENVLAATLAARLAGAAIPAIRRGVRSFRGVEHRIEFVSEIEGVRYYNDSKATNVDSAVKAIESFEQPLVLILGGLDKGGDFSRLRDLVRARARAVLVLGQASALIAGALEGCGDVRLVPDLRQAVQSAAGAALPGDVVLLSPACASFDMFMDYEDRGRTFKRLVRELQNQPTTGRRRAHR